jgi:hypothetical protein
MSRTAIQVCLGLHHDKQLERTALGVSLTHELRFGWKR